ncbi:pilus assembly protein [Arhodomonas sp. AD133]|uniref:pilus assembly protein n=1 Tax=Arhodomonas sp. AD133 TaxID=3415009 RepID=UPI003EB7C888
MRQRIPTISRRALVALAPTLLCVPGVSMADPGTLADVPLYLSDAVKPNVMLLVDDSGSMDWEVLKTEGARTAHPYANNSGTLDFTPDNSTEERELCHGYNALAYNPNVDYTPWFGEDSNGNEFDDQSLSDARENAYQPSTGQDISGHYYFLWNDADGDGEYDSGECPTGSSDRVNVSGLDAADQTNYANWYTYYRKREFVAKRAMTDLVAGADMRMGLGTLHDNNDVGTAVTDVGDEDDDPDKQNLLEQLARVNSTGGTPLRKTLAATGDYFDMNTGNGGVGFTAESPILGEDEGGACQQNFAILMSDGYWNGNAPRNIENEDGDNDTDFDGDSYADTHKDTLADVAMRYYERDLAPNLADKVPTRKNIDENPAQHLSTFTVAFGINGTLTENPPNRDDAFSWPKPEADKPTTIDDMRHAAWNGRGQFLSASNPQELVDSLRSALSSIEERVGSSSGVAFSSVSLQNDTAAYIATYNSAGWSGDLTAIPVDPSTAKLEATPAWQAAAKLDNKDWTTRNLYTANSNGSGIPLEWGDLSTAQRNDLRTNPDGTQGSDTLAQARLDYVKGNRTHEASGTAHDFRQRNSRLGDIVHSKPVQHNGVVFVGANDGMLHGFDADTGEEVMGYVPSALFSDSTLGGLHYLTNPSYTHRYYVDLPLTLAPEPVDGKEILVGGLRGGGRGLFALDVTNPDAFDENDVLWEFTAGEDDDLGYTFSQPVIAKVPTTNGSQWAVIVGNGYNNTGTGDARLFVLDLETGSVLKEISTGAGTQGDRNGLSSPAVIDSDRDGVVNRAYAGDLSGNLWAFDLSDPDTSKWGVAYSNKKPLFTGASNQAITAAPTVRLHPYIRTDSNNEPNALVLFGSGRMLTESDKGTTAKQSMYAIWDRGTPELSQSNLTQQTFISEDDSKRVLNTTQVPYTDSSKTGRYGWYIDLPKDKERVTTRAVVRGDIVYFTTQIPSGTPCSAGGSGWLMAVSVANGGATKRATFDYDGDETLGDEGDFVTIKGEDHSIGGSRFEDQGAPSKPTFIGDRVYTACSDSTANCAPGGGGTPPLVPGVVKPLSWEEITPSH